jgi:hypothetical protein
VIRPRGRFSIGQVVIAKKPPLSEVSDCGTGGYNVFFARLQKELRDTMGPILMTEYFTLLRFAQSGKVAPHLQ